MSLSLISKRSHTATSSASAMDEQPASTDYQAQMESADFEAPDHSYRLSYDKLVEMNVVRATQ